QLPPARYPPAKIGDAEATFPIFDQLLIEDRHLRIYEDSYRDGATRPVAFDDGNRKGFVNLRSGQPDAVILHHRFEHVVYELLSAYTEKALRGDTLRLHSEHRMSKVTDLQDGHLSGMTRLIQLLTVWVFETRTPDVNHFSNNGYGNFFRQYRADIESDGHVYA